MIFEREVRKARSLRDARIASETLSFAAALSSFIRRLLLDNFEYDETEEVPFVLEIVVAFRQFAVKGASFDVCLCRYHLAWGHQCGALFAARVKSKASVGCDCPNPRDPYEVRRRLVCRPQGPLRDDGSANDLVEGRMCIRGECKNCPGLLKMICAPEMDLLKTAFSKWQSWQKKLCTYERNEPKKIRKTFVLLMPLSLSYWPKCKEIIRLYCYITK